MPDSAFKIGGHFEVACYNPDGSLAWWDRLSNGVTTAGLDKILAMMFRTDAKINNWYMGLLALSGTAGLQASDTMSSHAGWTEVHSEYSESPRPSWAPPAPVGSGGESILVNSTNVQFTFTSSKVVDGIFIVSNSTKGGTDGTLWSTGSFSTARSLAVGQQLRVFYRLKATTA